MLLRAYALKTLLHEGREMDRRPLGSELCPRVGLERFTYRLLWWPFYRLKKHLRDLFRK